MAAVTEIQVKTVFEAAQHASTPDASSTALVKGLTPLFNQNGSGGTGSSAWGDLTGIPDRITSFLSLGEGTVYVGPDGSLTTYPISDFGKDFVAKSTAALARTALGAEASLGNPASDGRVLSSTMAGVRSWVLPNAHAHSIADVTNLQASLDAKLATVTGDATSRTANTFYAAPSASAGVATFRAIVVADLPSSGATAGSYGSASMSVSATVDAKGRVTAMSATSIAIDASQVTTGTLGYARGGTGLSAPGATAGNLRWNGSAYTIDTATYALASAIPAASSTTPAALGTAAVGTGTTWARADHVHAMPTAAQVGAEPALGNPSVSGYVLSSTAAGVRSWIAQPTAHALDGALHTISGKTAGQVLLATAATTFAFTTISGDATLSGAGALTLASVITAGGPVGSSSVVPVITYDAKGRLTAVSSATITPASIGAQPVLTNPVTGTATANQVPYWATASTLSGSANFVFDGVKTLNVGVSSSATSLNPRVNILQYTGQAGGGELYIGAAGVAGDENSAKVILAGGHRLLGMTTSEFKLQRWNSTSSTWATVLGSTSTVTSSLDVKFYGVVTAAAGVAGNASTATKLATARTLTVGSTGKAFDGTADISWTLAEIGAASAHSHTSQVLSLGDATTHGGLKIGNVSIGGWHGIEWSDSKTTRLLVNDTAGNNYIGFYDTTGWKWSVDRSGALITGSVPWGKLTGIPSLVTGAGSTGFVSIWNGSSSISYSTSFAFSGRALTIGDTGNSGLLQFKRIDGSVSASIGYTASATESQELRFSSYGGGSYFRWDTNAGEKMRLIEDGTLTLQGNHRIRMPNSTSSLVTALAIGESRSSDVSTGNGVSFDFKLDAAETVKGRISALVNVSASRESDLVFSTYGVSALHESLRLRGSDNSAWFYGRVVPSSGAAYDLGTSGNRWNNLYVDGFQFGDSFQLTGNGTSVIALSGGTNTLPVPVVGNVLFIYAANGPNGSVDITAPTGYNIQYRSSGTTTTTVAGGTLLTFNSMCGIAIGCAVYNSNPVWRLIW